MHPLLQKSLGIAKIKLQFLDRFAAPLSFLAARLYVGKFFWQSGQTKYKDLSNARDLFEYEYLPNWEKNRIKNIFGMDISFPVPDITFAVYASTFGELILAALLMVGLGARIAAAGIFVMTLSIEMFVYPGVLEHYYWLLIMAMIVACGPGKISLDHLIRKKFLP